MNNQICPATPEKVNKGTMFAGLSENSKYPNILFLYNPYKDYDAAIKIFDNNTDDKFVGYVGLSISGSTGLRVLLLSLVCLVSYHSASQITRKSIMVYKISAFMEKDRNLHLFFIHYSNHMEPTFL